jgi:hypothetical protein
MKRPDQVLAHWVSIDVPAQEGERSLAVKVDPDQNRIHADTKGIEELTVFLNDEIVNLDREVEVVVNGHVARKERLERGFDQLLDKEPIRIRRALYLGWLFPAQIAKIVLGPDGVPLPPPAGDPPPGADDAPREEMRRKKEARGAFPRSDASILLLRGQPERIVIPDAERDPGVLVWCLARAWWRPAPFTDGGTCESATRAVLATLDASRWAWLATRSAGPFPGPGAGAEDPDPILAAVVGDRQLRDRAGHAQVVRETPLRTLVKDPRVGEEVAWFLRDVMEYTYRGPDAAITSEARERFESARVRNRMTLVGAVLGLFVLAVLLPRVRVG